MDGTLTKQRLADMQAQDTKILQKLNAAHRDAFTVKFPSQVEHCLRLTLERLQAGLDKRGEFDMTKPDTWILSTAEIADLAEAAERLHNIRKDL